MTEQLKKLPLFAGFTESELGTIKAYFTLKTYEKDDIILALDDIKKSLFIVASGNIVSTITLPGSIERKKGEYNTGDFFGEISLFGNMPADNSYCAAVRSELLIIQEKELRAIIENHPGIGISFISNMLSLTIQQLRKSSRFFADVVQWGENASRRVITDELTGVYNRAFLDDALKNSFNVSMRDKKPLSLLMIDIDNCRKINESLGMETGNKIIAELVGIIRNIISENGIIARYGGDEFSVILPETDVQKAKTLAEKIRGEIEGYNFLKYLSGKNIPITTSIGISSYPETAADIAALRGKADSSLYRAKELGRNRVACDE